MGTRHLVRIKHQDKLVLSQYGQWDGYPTGQGWTISKFLSGELEPAVKLNWNSDANKHDKIRQKEIPDVQFERKTFLSNLDLLFEPTEKQLKASYKLIGHDGDSNWIASDLADKHSTKFPSISRDTGARILQIIQAGGQIIPTVITKSFDLCEWCWTLDFDRNILSCGHDPKSALAAWPLDKPPSLKKLKNLEEQS